MKISALLSLAFACTVSASTYGQNYKLSMNKQDCSISEVLKEIEKNSEYTFFLNDNQVNVNRKTSVKANNASLEEVLEQALKNTGYQYEIVDRQIIIKSKSVSSVSHPNALFQSSPRKITGQVTALSLRCRTAGSRTSSTAPSATPAVASSIRWTRVGQSARMPISFCPFTRYVL